MAREPGDRGEHGHRKGGFETAQRVAVTLGTGICGGLLVGYGLDRLLHTLPAFTAVGLFVGFGIALYTVFLETK
jgi:F0F1-type ATP synthase assembly protein I